MWFNRIGIDHEQMKFEYVFRYFGGHGRNRTGVHGFAGRGGVEPRVIACRVPVVKGQF